MHRDKLVADIIRGRPVYHVNTGAMALSALRFMYKHDGAKKSMKAIGVLDQAHNFFGIFYESDIAHHVGHDGKLEADVATVLRMRNYERSEDTTVTPNNTVLQCFKLMEEGNRTHLAVLNGNKFLGLVSHRDVDPLIDHELDEDKRDRQEELKIVAEIEQEANEIEKKINEAVGEIPILVIPKEKFRGWISRFRQIFENSL